MSDEPKDKDLETLTRHTAMLSEHFDTVQIFVTKHEAPEQRTYAMQDGCGNWYARLGQVAEWKVVQDERAREHERHTDG